MLPTLRRGAAQLGLALTEAQLAAFVRYGQELAAWNEKVNLTRIVEPEAVAVKHFLDSLSVSAALVSGLSQNLGYSGRGKEPFAPTPPKIGGAVPAPLPPGLALVDVGSGAGFPGLPLKIAYPQISLTLVESVGKKCDFLRHVVACLDLKDVTVLQARAEEVGRRPEHRERYDAAVVRAVAPLRVAAEYLLPLVRLNGLAVAQKGRYPAEEAAEMETALARLGGELSQILPANVPGLAAERHLVVLKKVRPTPRQYPRRPGLPAKKPL